MKVFCFDLDDTIYKEIEFLKSAYREIALFAAEKTNGCNANIGAVAYDAMLRAYYDGKNAFEVLNTIVGTPLPIEKYLDIYRNHKPDIRLDVKTERVLSTLKNTGGVLGLITDGRSAQQRHKIEALGLYRFFEETDIVISEEFGTEKPSERNYNYFMERYPKADMYVYVGDNPQKDFVAPNHLGWETVGLCDNGENIHKQNVGVPPEYLPKLWIKNLTELPWLQGEVCR